MSGLGWVPRRRVVRVLLLLLFAYALWLGGLFFAEPTLIFPRSLAGAGLADGEIPRQIERVWLPPDADGARVEAWFLPARPARGSGGDGTPDPLRPLAAAPKGEPAPAVIFFHGNAELIDHNLSVAQRYAARGISTLLVEYRGYGRSTGSPSQRALVADAVRWHDWLVARPDVSRGRVLIHGRSIGTAIAAQLAGARPPAALILESPLTSVASFAGRFGGLPFLVRNPFRTDRVLPNLSCPVLILHSRQDEIIPYSHGEKLARLAPHATLVTLTGGHNSGLSEQPTYWPAIDSLLREVFRD